MNEQKSQDTSSTDKGYDEAAHTPWVPGTPPAAPAQEDEDHQTAGLGGSQRPSDPTGTQGPEGAPVEPGST